MDYEEFFYRALIAALPEAARSKRSQGPAVVAERAKEQAEACCEALDLKPKAAMPKGRPKSTRLSKKS